MVKKRKHKKLKLRTSFKLFLLVLIVLVVYLTFFNNKKIKVDLSKFNFLNPIKEHRNRQKRYNECIANPLIEEKFNENTLAKKEEIISYSKNNGLKYKFEDLTFGYQISYGENDQLYGASLIKLVTAIYLIDNDIDLSQTMKYTSNFVSSSSEGMSKRKLGEQVSLKDLMKYSITVSDNTAHHMLVSYIGKNKLREYGKSLGADVILSGAGDDYGNQNTHDTNIYLKKAFELINNTENGKLLKEYMLNNKKNNLTVDGMVTIAHKYGSYEAYFHDIGLNLDTHPYAISVLTTKGDPNGGKYMNNLSKLTKEFSDLYYSNHESYCKEYSQKKD